MLQRWASATDQVVDGDCGERPKAAVDSAHDLVDLARQPLVCSSQKHRQSTHTEANICTPTSTEEGGQLMGAG